MRLNGWFQCWSFEFFWKYCCQCEIFDTISTYSYTTFIFHPTRLRSKTSTDNVFFNSLEYPSFSGNLSDEISDHLIQFVISEGVWRIFKQNSPTGLIKWVHNPIFSYLFDFLLFSLSNTLFYIKANC